jgi:hypothetical protein
VYYSIPKVTVEEQKTWPMVAGIIAGSLCLLAALFIASKCYMKRKQSKQMFAPTIKTSDITVDEGKLIEAN